MHSLMRENGTPAVDQGGEGVACGLEGFRRFIQ